MPTYSIDQTKIHDFENSRVNDADDLDTTFAELVTKHDLLAGITVENMFDSLSMYQLVMAIRAGWLG